MSAEKIKQRKKKAVGRRMQKKFHKSAGGKKDFHGAKTAKKQESKPKKKPIEKKIRGKIISGKKEISRVQKKQKQIPEKKNVPDARIKEKAFSPVEKLEAEYNEIKAMLSQKRKAGIDTLIEDLKMILIPPKIQFLRAEFSERDFGRVKEMLEEIRREIISYTPYRNDFLISKDEGADKQDNSPENKKDNFSAVKKGGV